MSEPANSNTDPGSRWLNLSLNLTTGSALNLASPTVAGQHTVAGPFNPTLDAGPGWSSRIPTIAGFEINQELGRGGMGVVYRANEIALQRPVALKMLVGGSSGPEQLARFRVEAAALAKLNHPNIVQIHAFGEHEGQPYFVMEFVAGGSLAAVAKSRPVDPRNAAELVATLADAVAFAHQHGIIHRDLKPANVLLSAAHSELHTLSNPKIADFGLARTLDGSSSQTQTGEVVGTPQYMAPEQALGLAKEIGPAVDIYALGALLYELLTGRPPFTGATAMDTLLQVQHLEPLPPIRLQPALPRDVNTICLKCLEKDPRKRYPTAQALADDLRRFLEQRPIVARPVSAWERGVKWARRRPAVAGLLATLFLVVLAALAGLSVLYLHALAGWNEADKQTLLLEAEKKEAVTQRNDAERQRAEAVKQRDRARAAIETLANPEALKFLETQGEMTIAQRSMLRNLVAFYLETVREPAQTRAERRDRAFAFSNLGTLQHQLNDPHGALAANLEAVKLFRELRIEDPKSLHDLARFASCLNAAGACQVQLGHPAEAVKLYRESLDLFAQAHQQVPESPGILEHYAFANLNLGKLLIEQGDFASGQLQLASAQVRFAELVKLQPKLAHYQVHVVEAQNAVAMALYRQGKLQAAMKQLEEALASLNQIEDKKLPQLQQALAMNYSNRGLLLQDAGRGKEALAAHRQAVEVVRQMRKDRPNAALTRRLLASCLNNLGLILRQQKQWDEAVATFTEAITLRREMAEQEPRDIDNRVALGGLCCNLANVHRDQKQREPALAAYQEAEAELMKALKQDPTFTDAKKYLFNTRGTRAQLYETFDTRLAAKEWRQAEAVAPPEVAPRLRARQARLLARAGDFAEARERVKSVPTDGSMPLPVYFELACAHALLAGEPGLPTPKREADQREALKWLNRLQQRGIPHNLADLKVYDSEDDLRALRDLPEFEAYLKKLGGK